VKEKEKEKEKTHRAKAKALSRIFKQPSLIAPPTVFYLD
jgi:hypothetical protein